MDIRIVIPKPHPAQQEVLNSRARYRVLECGRRFGKSITGMIATMQTAIDGKPTAWFAPSYKFLIDPWREMDRILTPIVKRSSRVEQRIDLLTGGSIDFWTLENKDAGRGRKYKEVVIDEAGIARDLEHTWNQAIRPTLSDLKGRAWFLGTPKGRRFFHTLFLKGQGGGIYDKSWKSWRMPTTANPYIDPAEVEAARLELPKHVFEQEFLGIPADDGGNPFDQKAILRCVMDVQSSRDPVCFGVDLAKSMDWTWVIGLDEDGAVCLSERWQSDWAQTQRRITGIIGNVPSLMDSTGVGDPIVENIQRVLPMVEGFKFTSQSKQQLMEGLSMAIQQRSVRFADKMLVQELMSFEYNYTKKGVSYEAPSGLHDDGVMALALAWRKFNDTSRHDIPVSLADTTMQGERHWMDDDSDW